MKDQAMQQLYRVWGFETAIDEARCDSAIRANLGCVQTQGSLANVVKLNYPAMIHLAEEDGRELYAVLLHVEDNQADILLGSQHWKVSTEWLNKVWDQDYTVLWRMPDSGKTLISKRSGADDIQWLETKVSQALHQPVRNKVSRFDAPLETKVRQFQKQEGLSADGVAGEQTLLRLSIRSREAVPRLNGRIPAQQATMSSDETDDSEGAS